MSINLKNYLTTSAVCILANGFVKSGSWSGTPTWEDSYRLYEYIFGSPSKEQIEYVESNQLDKDFHKHKEKADELAYDTYWWVSDKENVENNDYMSKLKLLFTNQTVDTKSLPIVASAVSSYIKEQKYQEEKKLKDYQRQKESSESEYVGTVGQKYSVNINSVEISGSFYGFDGNMCYVNKIKDDNGNVFIWMTGKQVPSNAKHITGTIKDHREFNGVKQTILTRCKIN